MNPPAGLSACLFRVSCLGFGGLCVELREGMGATAWHFSRDPLSMLCSAAAFVLFFPCLGILYLISVGVLFHKRLGKWLRLLGDSHY